MGAVFTDAAVYRITAKCETPFRTGGADGDTEMVLRDAGGRAFVQGTSIAGALRDWLENSCPESAVTALMGDLKTAGHLAVSDGVFTDNAVQKVRPRVRIDPRTGTAANKKKFDIAHIGTGAGMEFSLTWMGQKDQKGELDAVEGFLAALNSGDVRLGAQKSNGFGRLSLTVTRRDFDMTDPDDRQAWLEDRDDGKLLVLPKNSMQTRVLFTLKGRADSLLVRSSVPVFRDSIAYTVNIQEGGVPILPGSSVKGAVRARAAVIAGAAGSSVSLDDLFGCAGEHEAGGKPGRVWFDDLRLTESTARPITRIRINRFTGGVIRQAMIHEEPLSTPVEIRILVPDEPLACALILYALRDLGLGLYSLGGGASVGHGYVLVDSIEAADPGGRSMVLKKVPSGFSLEDPDGMAAEWLHAWGGAKREN